MKSKRSTSEMTMRNHTAHTLHGSAGNELRRSTSSWRSVCQIAEKTVHLSNTPQHHTALADNENFRTRSAPSVTDHPQSPWPECPYGNVPCPGRDYQMGSMFADPWWWNPLSKELHRNCKPHWLRVSVKYSMLLSTFNFRKLPTCEKFM